MSSTFSTNLAIELIGTGDQAGVWGNTTNTNLGTLIEQAISGYVTQAVATGTDTTITIPNGATGVARNMYIELTGTGGASTNLIVPANKKLYFIFNNSTGAVTVKVSGQTGVSVPQGKKVVLTSNGTDIVNGLNYIADFGSNSATITQLTATSATITNLTLTSLVISNLSIASANITTLTSSSATITNLLGTTLTISGNSFLATSSGNVGIGTSSPGSKLEVKGAFSKNTGDETTWGIRSSDTTAMAAGVGGGLIFTGIYTTGGAASAFAAIAGAKENSTSGNLLGQLRFYTTDGSGINQQRAVIDSSGNLGLGVTPSAWNSGAKAFDIANGAVYAFSSSNNIALASNAFYNTSNNWIYKQSSQATLYAGEAGQHRFFTAASGTAGNAITFTQAMTLDASGDWYLGGTATSTTTGSRGRTAAIIAPSNNSVLTIESIGTTANATYAIIDFVNTSQSSGSTRYAEIYASRSNTSTTALDGYMAFATTSGGTTSERARITAAGDLLVGATSQQLAGTTLQVGAYQTSGTFSAKAIGVYYSTVPGFYSNSYDGTYSIASIGINSFDNSNGSASVSSAVNGGYVSAYLDLMSAPGGSIIRFRTGGNNERARITSDGDFCIGRTTANGRLHVEGSTAGTQVKISGAGQQGIEFRSSTNTAGTLIGRGYGSDDANDFFIYDTVNSALRVFISTGGEVRIAAQADQGAYNLQVNGTGVWAAGAYVNGSDARLKDNIQSLDSGLDVVKAMRPVTFQYKPEHSKDQSVQPGFIAQELQQAMAGKPYLEGVVQAGPEYLNVAYQNIIPILTKAIQEQQDMINELKAKVAALETK